MPRLRLVEDAGPNQGIKGKGRVPKPAKSIVPIARPSQLFGQGRCRGRDNAPGLPVRKRLQSQKRPKNRVAPAVRRLESRRPAGPEGMDLFARLCELLPCERRQRRAKRRRPIEDEARLFALAEGEIAECAKILSARLNWRVEQHSVRARDELKPPVLLLRRPRHDGAIVEPHDDLGPHGDLALKAPHDAHELGRPIAPVHEIGQGDRTVGRRENRFEDQSVAQIPSCDLNVILRGRDQPSSMLRAPKKRAKTRAAVEAGQAQPVDRAVTPDQRHRLTVSNDGVVLNSKRHHESLSRES